MSSARDLLAILADGALHPGPQLTASLGVTRPVLAGLVEELRGLGVPVASVARRGLKLADPVELLDSQAIRATAARQVGVPAFDLEVLFRVGSTNEYLFDPGGEQATRPRVVFAEIQQAGRGRRGRSWIAPFGSSLTFSIGWCFARPPPDLSALSLAMGVEVVRALQSVGTDAVRLKWPNDIVCNGRKLGGILTQLRSEPGGPAFVVTGLGLNVRLPGEALRSIEADLAGMPGDLHGLLGPALPGRNELAGRLVGRMLAGLGEFDRHGFAAFRADWERLDALNAVPVVVHQFDGHIDGIARGVDSDGALLVEVDGRVSRYVSGEVTVRARGREAA